MSTKILFSSIALAGALIAAGSLPAVRAASVFDITYPIPELNGCTDRVACKAYCNDPVNQSACENFAKEHGITVHVEASAPTNTPPEQRQGESAARVNAVLSDGGPGGCAAGASDPERACRAYCDSISHIQECVQYGESHGLLSGDQLAQAKKVAAALDKGVALPEGCTNQRSCERSCREPSSLAQAKSCFAFGKAAGLLPPDFDEARAEKIFSSIQNGSAPFSSFRDFQKCEHPTDPAVIKKCTDFAVQNGILSQQEADTIQQTGGKGPGGCVGRDSCENYCNDHGDECFQFAREHHLVTPDQQARMEHAAAQVQDALRRAPEAVRMCIVNAIGHDTLDAIMAGTKPDSPEIGQKMQACFQKNESSYRSEDRQGTPPPGAFYGNPPPKPYEKNSIENYPPYPNQPPTGTLPPNSGTFVPPPPDAGTFAAPPPASSTTVPQSSASTTGPLPTTSFLHSLMHAAAAAILPFLKL